MAKMKNKKSTSASMPAKSAQSSRGSVQDFSTEQYDGGEEMESDDSDESEESNYQAAGSRQAQGSSQTAGSRSVSANSSRNSSSRESQEFDPGQLLESAREFIEGHPGRATIIGALVGGAVAGLFATERGRQLVRAGYSYARPMIADYARGFVTANTENAIDKALPQ